MSCKLLSFLFLSFISISFCNGYQSWIERVFRDECIVPQLIDDAPLHELNVIYNCGRKYVDYGNTIKPDDAVEQPTRISFNHVNPSKYYLLAMIDPDAMSRKDPYMRNVKHWLVGNIKGCNLDVNKGLVMAEYTGPEPPAGTGKHRYIFLLFEQPCELSFKSEGPLIGADQVEGRLNWDLKKFIKKYNLKGPIAGNYFLSKDTSA